MDDYRLEVVDDVASAGATEFARSMRAAVEARGAFVALLSGGSTPQPMYRLLARETALPWDRARVLWGDERFVPHDHPDSNYRMTKELLLDHVPIPPAHIHPWPYYLGDPERSARELAGLLEAQLSPAPLFDFNLMGLGENAHTASLFPGTGAIDAPGLTTVVRPAGEHVRLSMTPRALSASRQVVFLVSGAPKRPALEETLRGPREPERFPAQTIRAVEDLVWITDIAI